MTPLAPFRRELERLAGRVDHVILFGSHARGEPREDSDVDVLVVSPAYEGLTYLKRVALTRRAWTPGLPVDFLTYTPEEFERLRHQATIVQVALQDGREIASA